MPGIEFHGRDGHADAEEHAREDAFRAAFAEGERQPRHHDGYQRQSARDGACERLLENTHGVLPGRVAIHLSEHRRGQRKTHEKCHDHSDGTDPTTYRSPAYFHFGTSERVLKEVHAFNGCAWLRCERKCPETGKVRLRKRADAS